MKLALDDLDPFANAKLVSEVPEPAPPESPRTSTERFWSAYAKLFSIHEIEQSVILKWIFAGLLGGFFITFTYWSIRPDIIDRARYVPWPWFISSSRFMVFDGPHAKGELFTVLLTLLGACALALGLRRWRSAHALMLLMFLVKGGLLLLNRRAWGNYHLFHLSYAALFLFFPYKLYFIRRAIVVFYLFAGTLKLDEGWIVGTYFTPLKEGMPIFPTALAPLATNGVIALELGVTWLLLSERWLWQRIALVAYILFHIYSGTMVGFLYPTIVTPIVVAAFAPRVRNGPIPFSRGTVPVFLLLGLLSIGQSLKYTMPGDPKLTMAANDYGVFMFEANHQCQWRMEVKRKNGPPFVRYHASASSMSRCEPFSPWNLARKLPCSLPETESVAVQWDHSINGGPFYRMIDTENICKLEFNAFTKNDWIRLPGKDAEIVGYPVKNLLMAHPEDGEPQTTPVTSIDDPVSGHRLLVPPLLKGNTPPELTSLQLKLLAMEPGIRVFWWAFFGISVVYFVGSALRLRLKKAV